MPRTASIHLFHKRRSSLRHDYERANALTVVYNCRGLTREQQTPDWSLGKLLNSWDTGNIIRPEREQVESENEN